MRRSWNYPMKRVTFIKGLCSIVEDLVFPRRGPGGTEWLWAPSFSPLFEEKKIYRCQRSIQRYCCLKAEESKTRTLVDRTIVWDCFVIIAWLGWTSKFRFKEKFLFIFYILSTKIVTRCIARNYVLNLAMNAIMHFHIDSFHRPRANYGNHGVSSKVS